MTLEKYLDNELRSDTSDVVIVDEYGNEITSTLPGVEYDKFNVVAVNYETVARIKVKKK